MKQVLLDQNTDEWLAWRVNGLTATESVVLAGLNPDKTPLMLYQEKVGIRTPEDLSMVPAVRFGHEMEPVVRSKWEQLHLTVADPVCGEWDENPVFRASFDGLTLEGCPLEIKCPTPDGNTLKDVRANGRQSVAFKRYFVQVQHQLLVSGASHGWLVFMDGENLIEFEIQRDEEEIQKIIERGNAFWFSVMNREAPQADPERDRYVPESQEEINEWLQASEIFCKAQEQLDVLKEQMERWTKVQSEVKKQLKRIVGTRCGADFGGILVTHSFSKGPVNAKKLIEAGVSEELIDSTREETERWIFKVNQTGSVLPKGVTDPELEQAVSQAERPESPCWF